MGARERLAVSIGKKKGELAVAGSRTAKLADLAGFYGPAVCGLSGIEPKLALIVLDANMDRIKAVRWFEEIRKDPEKGNSLHPDTLFDLVMEATGSERLANAYRVAAIRAKWKPR